MEVYYGIRRKLKIDKQLGAQECPNCGHMTEMALAHESCKVHVYFIPVWFYTGWRMKFCPNCGTAVKLKKADFKAIKKGLIEA